MTSVETRVVEILDQAQVEGVRLRVRSGGKLAAKPAPSTGLLAKILDIRPAIIAHLAQDEFVRARIAEGPCYVCGGRRFWTSRWKVTCAVCHPAAAPALIVRQFEAPALPAVA